MGRYFSTWCHTFFRCLLHRPTPAFYRIPHNRHSSNRPYLTALRLIRGIQSTNPLIGRRCPFSTRIGHIKRQPRMGAPQSLTNRLRAHPNTLSQSPHYLPTCISNLQLDVWYFIPWRRPCVQQKNWKKQNRNSLVIGCLIINRFYHSILWVCWKLCPVISSQLNLPFFRPPDPPKKMPCFYFFSIYRHPFSHTLCHVFIFTRLRIGTLSFNRQIANLKNINTHTQVCVLHHHHTVCINHPIYGCQL